MICEIKIKIKIHIVFVFLYKNTRNRNTKNNNTKNIIKITETIPVEVALQVVIVTERNHQMQKER